MSEAIGVALVVAALAPLTFGSAMQALLDRQHRRRTGRSVPQRRRRRQMRLLAVVTTIVAAAGALLVALTH